MAMHAAGLLLVSHVGTTPAVVAFAIVLALLVERMGLVATCIIALVASAAAATASWHLGASARREPR